MYIYFFNLVISYFSLIQLNYLTLIFSCYLFIFYFISLFLRAKAFIAKVKLFDSTGHKTINFLHSLSRLALLSIKDV